MSIGLSATGDVKARRSVVSNRGVRHFLLEAAAELINMFIVIYERIFNIQL